MAKKIWENPVVIILAVLAISYFGTSGFTKNPFASQAIAPGGVAGSGPAGASYCPTGIGNNVLQVLVPNTGNTATAEFQAGSNSIVVTDPTGTYLYNQTGSLTYSQASTPSAVTIPCGVSGGNIYQLGTVTSAAIYGSSAKTIFQAVGAGAFTSPTSVGGAYISVKNSFNMTQLAGFVLYTNYTNATNASNNPDYNLLTQPQRALQTAGQNQQLILQVQENLSTGQYGSTDGGLLIGANLPAGVMDQNGISLSVVNPPVPGYTLTPVPCIGGVAGGFGTGVNQTNVCWQAPAIKNPYGTVNFLLTITSDVAAANANNLQNVVVSFAPITYELDSSINPTSSQQPVVLEAAKSSGILPSAPITRFVIPL